MDDGVKHKPLNTSLASQIIGPKLEESTKIQIQSCGLVFTVDKEDPGITANMQIK